MQILAHQSSPLLLSATKKGVVSYKFSIYIKEMHNSTATASICCCILQFCKILLGKYYNEKCFWYASLLPAMTRKTTT